MPSAKHPCTRSDSSKPAPQAQLGLLGRMVALDRKERRPLKKKRRGGNWVVTAKRPFCAPCAPLLHLPAPPPQKEIQSNGPIRIRRQRCEDGQRPRQARPTRTTSPPDTCRSRIGHWPPGAAVGPDRFLKAVQMACLLFPSGTFVRHQMMEQVGEHLSGFVAQRPNTIARPPLTARDTAVLYCSYLTERTGSQ